MIEDIETSLKIIVIGNGTVGKTSLTQRFAKNIFTTDYRKTLGVDFLMKKKYVKAVDREIEFMIWDTAGQEYYDAITKRYYRGASGALIVFSVTDYQSFLDVRKWLEKLKGECGEIPTYIIQNKIDIVSDTKVTDREASDLAKQLNLNLFKVSVKDNIMVNEVFESLAVDYFKKASIQDVRNNNPNNKIKISSDDVEDIKVIETKNENVPKNFTLKKEVHNDKDKKEEPKKKKKKSFCNIL